MVGWVVMIIGCRGDDNWLGGDDIGSGFDDDVGCEDDGVGGDDDVVIIQSILLHSTASSQPPSTHPQILSRHQDSAC